MRADRCIKLALLLSLIPLALRATSLLLGCGHGHGAPGHPWHGRSRTATAAATVAVVSAEAAVRGRPYRRARPRSALAASDGGTRRLRQVAAAAGDWFEDDKRLAPTGSNPLHNLRR